MKKRNLFRMVLALGCGGLVVSLWAADLTIDKIPVKAREALQKLAGDNKILEVEAEKEHGIQVYEAEWVSNGTHTEAEVTADGVLLEMEESVKAEAVPDSVKATATQALPGAPALHFTRHTVVFYEVEGKVDGKNKEISISPSGKRMGDEDEGDDEDDDDDKDEDGK